MRSTHWWLDLLVAFILMELVVFSLSVSAAPVVIDFEDLPAGSPGTPANVFVNTQYAAQGITFNDLTAFDYSRAIPGFAHSGTKAIEGCSGEGCRVPIEMSFTAAQPRVKVWVGYNGFFGERTESRTVVLRALDAGGGEVGRATTDLLIGSQPIPIRTSLEIISANANITRALVQLLFPDGSVAVTGGLAVDDVEFDITGPPPPCPTTQSPTVTLTRPINGQTVQINAFLIQSEISTTAPLEDARVIVIGPSGSRSMSIFGGPTTRGYGPVILGEALFPGVNTIIVEAKNCRGVGQSNPRTITFAPIASGTRFKLMGLEITQAIQDLDNTVPLIAGKRTFARAYLRVEGPTSEIREVSGVLTACRFVLREGLFPECGALLPIDPTSSSVVLQSLNRITVNSSTNITVKRQDINASLNFELPPNWINAAELLHLEIGSRLEIEGVRQMCRVMVAITRPHSSPIDPVFMSSLVPRQCGFDFLVSLTLSRLRVEHRPPSPPELLISLC